MNGGCFEENFSEIKVQLNKRGGGKPDWEE